MTKPTHVKSRDTGIVYPIEREASGVEMITLRTGRRLQINIPGTDRLWPQFSYANGAKMQTFFADVDVTLAAGFQTVEVKAWSREEAVELIRSGSYKVCESHVEIMNVANEEINSAGVFLK